MVINIFFFLIVSCSCMVNYSEKWAKERIRTSCRHSIASMRLSSWFQYLFFLKAPRFKQGTKYCIAFTHNDNPWKCLESKATQYQYGSIIEANTTHFTSFAAVFGSFYSTSDDSCENHYPWVLTNLKLRNFSSFVNRFGLPAYVLQVPSCPWECCS